MNGIICINKPQGFTSFDVIAKLRGILKIKRIGHAGTLDPMATGVLPVFVGRATKACDIMPDNHKAYTASFRLGTETDTQDSSGTVLKTFKADVSLEDINNKLKEFSGNIAQIPPMYSAVSVNGKRLYELARAGIEIERKPRNIFVKSLLLEEYNQLTCEGVLKIECSKGTYVRTIIYDIGRSLGCGAVMTALERTSSNGFDISECVTLGQVQEYADEGNADKLIVPIERVFIDFPEIHLDPKSAAMYRNGVKLTPDEYSAEVYNEGQKYRIFVPDNTFVGLAYIEDNYLRVYKNFT